MNPSGGGSRSTVRESLRKIMLLRRPRTEELWQEYGADGEI